MTRPRHEQLQKLGRLARLKADQELARFATVTAEVAAAEARIGLLEAELIAAAEGAAVWADDADDTAAGMGGAAIAGGGGQGERLAGGPSAAAHPKPETEADPTNAVGPLGTSGGWAAEMFAGDSGASPPPPAHRGMGASVPGPSARMGAASSSGPADASKGSSPGRANPGAVPPACVTPGQGLQAGSLVRARLAHALTRQVALDREAATVARASLQPGLDAARQAAVLAFGKADVMESLRKDLALARARKG